jgi:hypothetical protein
MMPSRLLSAAVACLAVLAVAGTANAQVVYYGAMRPVVPMTVYSPFVAAPVVAAPAYVANYTPAGNYAAVTAFSPPVYAAPAAVVVTANYAPAYMPAAPVAVTSFYAPTTVYSPVVAEPAVMPPVTAYYAPAAVAMPLYRRGPFGGLRPVRTAYYIPY